MKNRHFSFFFLLILLGGMTQGFAQDKKPVALEDIWLKYKFVPNFPSEFNWMKDDHYYSVLEDEQIVKYDVKANRPVAYLLDVGELKLKDPATKEPESVKTYTFSPDEKKVLLKTKVESVYRRSTRDRVHVYDLEKGRIHTLHGGKMVSFATFSPDNQKVAYVYENNIYYYDLNTEKKTAITLDGAPNKIINGGTDWVHEEEFAFTRAFFWSPDSKTIAYYRFDEGHVKEFNMPMYGALYPSLYTFKYPKAGERNAVVTLFFHELGSNQPVKAGVLNDSEEYIPRVKWTTKSDQLAVMRMNRLQNQLDILLVDSKTGTAKTILTEKSDTWITEVDNKTWNFLDNGDEFIFQSERDGWNHLYLYDLDGKLKKQITKGPFNVTGIDGIDEKNRVVYYSSTEVSHLDRHLYKVKFDGGDKEKLTREPGWHDITMSPGCSFYMDTYSTISEPPITRLRDNKGELLLTMEDNGILRTSMEKYNLSQPEFFTFKTSLPTYLDGWMIKPADFDPKKEYPVLMFVYGGPGSQTVKNQFGGFNYFWYQMLANMGYIVASVDNRGTGGKEAAFKKCTYGELGKYETEDQIEAAKYLGRQKYVDADRIGIWGWSYGGYLSSLCLTKGAEAFKMAIAVAPVTNWRFYDTIYTERYLKTPQLNASGYDDNSPINFVDQMKGKYLLVHGSADDNVHFQNSMEMVTALVNANKQFEQAFYPNKNHGIFGGNTRYHLYKKMTDFITENL